MLHDKFYETDDHKRICELVSQVDAGFVKKLAVYVRSKMYLRTVPIVLLGQLAKLGKLDAETVYQVIRRADEITELLAYYQQINGGGETLKPLSKAIQKGIKLVFERGKFDEYQYAKYNRKSKIRLRDALNLAHPRPQDDEQNILFKKILSDTLQTPYTWEVQLSTRGNKKEVWEELINSGRLPYMATIRNLRNIVNAGVNDACIEKVASYISSPEAVRKSKQLPVRFLSAYREIQELASYAVQPLCEALERAVKVSIENIRLFRPDTRVLVACDVSGSMLEYISPKSSIYYYDVGLLFGMLLQSRCQKCITGIFGRDWAVEALPKDTVLANTRYLHSIEGKVGYSTDGH